MWQSLGLLTPHPDRWVSTQAVTNTPLVRVSWLKGSAPLHQINKRFLIRRKFISGEVDKAIIIYASDEPLVVPFEDLNESFSVQLKKLIPHRQLISEPYYQVSIEDLVI